MRVPYRGQIRNWRRWFLWREENQSTQRNLGEGNNQQKTQPTYMYDPGPMQCTIEHVASDLLGYQLGP